MIIHTHQRWKGFTLKIETYLGGEIAHFKWAALQNKVQQIRDKQSSKVEHNTVNIP